MNGVFDKLTNPEFKIGGATFRANKLKGLAGFELLEKLRTSLGGQSMNTVASDASDEASVGQNMLKVLCSVPTENVMEIRQAVFECIDVKLAGTDRFVPVNSVLAVVDNLIEAVDNYEIIVRGVAVNFTKSIRDLMSRIGLQAQGQGLQGDSAL